MELLLRFLNFLNVLLGRIVLPLKRFFAKLPLKPLPALNHPEILYSSATKLAEKIRTKQLTSEQLVSAFIERCQQVNEQLNAIIENRYEAALDEARNVDRVILNNEKPAEQLAIETPLLGVPITVKECLMVKGSSYTAGAKLRKGIRATEDGDAVAALRNAGAIPIAVTNMPELCCGGETFSELIGYTNNPYNANITSGGSSGGESALISSAASVLGLGSDFAGSIRNPSSFCGIFGHRPTSSIVSLRGHLPNSPDEHFQKVNSIGPMCRYAEDLKLALAIMAGSKGAELLKLDKKVDIKQLKIYYMLDNGFKLSEISVDRDIKTAILKAANHFKSAYDCSVQKIHLAEVDDVLEMCGTKMSQIKDLSSAFYLKDPKNESGLFTEFVKSYMNKSSYSYGTLMTRLYIETGLFCVAESKRSKYILAMNNLENRFKELLQENGVLFYPSCPVIGPLKYTGFYSNTAIGYAMMVNILGLPSTHVPICLNKNGIPVGFQVIAAPNQDRLCFAVAQELETAFGGWVPPPMSS